MGRSSYTTNHFAACAATATPFTQFQSIHVLPTRDKSWKLCCEWALHLRQKLPCDVLLFLPMHHMQVFLSLSVLSTFAENKLHSFCGPWTKLTLRRQCLWWNWRLVQQQDFSCSDSISTVTRTTGHHLFWQMTLQDASTDYVTPACSQDSRFSSVPCASQKQVSLVSFPERYTRFDLKEIVLKWDWTANSIGSFCQIG